MPELPDIVVYLEALGPRVVGRPLEALRIPSPFLLRTVDPPVADVTGRVVQELRRLGKRIVFRLDDDYFIVLHLMIASTDRRLFSGIGNAYSDEILHAARLSPLQLTSTLTNEEVARLHQATRATLRAWIERLRAETGDGFPEKVTAFREGMAVHGRYRKPCPVCGSAVQRIRY